MRLRAACGSVKSALSVRRLTAKSQWRRSVQSYHARSQRSSALAVRRYLLPCQSRRWTCVARRSPACFVRRNEARRHQAWQSPVSFSPPPPAPSPPWQPSRCHARTLSSAQGRNTRTHRRGVAGAQLQTRTTEPHACAHQATRPRLLAAREHSSACYSAMPEAAAAGVSRHAAHGPNSRLFSSGFRLCLLGGATTD